MRLVKAGKIAKDPNKQNDIEPIIRIPKIRTGTKTENISAENPKTTESPLKSIPLPDIVKVFVIASYYKNLHNIR